jgi:hypothetical protein
VNKLLVIALAGCWTSSAPPPPPPMPPPARTLSIVTSMVVVDACPSSKKIDRKAATKEIEALVGPCQKVPGGAAHFSATLLPDGRVELASPSGNPDEGIVPTCVLETKAAFRHKLRVAQPCRFDVKLEERRG